MILDIKNAYMGDSTVNRMYLGTDLVYMSGHPDILLEYLANGADDGASNPDVYFDTGFTPQLSTKVEFKYETASDEAGRAFGCGNTSDANAIYNFNIKSSGTTPSGTTKSSLKFIYRGANIVAPITSNADTKYTVTLYGTYSGNSASAINMVVNGTTYTRSASISANITSAQSAYIFRWHGHDNLIPSGVKFYYLKIWDNNNLVRFYVPVLHWNNGQYVACFYDKVNNSYIYNLGTDTVAYKVTDSYLADYFYNSSNSATTLNYNTGFRFQSNYRLEAKIRPVKRIGASQLDQQLFFGRRVSGSFKMGLYAPYSGNSDPNASPNIGLYHLASASTAGGNNLQSVVWDTDYCFSTCYDLSTSKRIYYVGSTQKTAGADAQNVTADYTFCIFGDSTQGTTAGSRIYYACVSDNDLTTLKSYIPVLHNSVPCFYDVTSGTYINNSGTGTPSYVIKN